MIRTYANTKAEYNVAKARLECLMNEKEELYVKFFPINVRLTEASSHTNKRTDPMADYLNELTKINPITGMSLEDEITEARNKVGILKYYVRLMEESLKSTTGIENELFFRIVIKGYKTNRTIEVVAEKFNKDVRTIWRYYDNIKDLIKKCTNF